MLAFYFCFVGEPYDVVLLSDSKCKRNFCFGVENIPNSANGQMLILDNVPYEFTERYGILPRELYIRECYVELYEEATLFMLNPTKSIPSILFTGVPGIGKSMFLIYFLWRFSKDDRFKQKSFVFEVKFGLYYYFQQSEKDGEFFCSGEELHKEQIPLDEILLVADLEAHQGRAYPGKWTLIFSSPNPLRHGEVMKRANSVTYTVPTWSFEELRMVEPEVIKWLSYYELFGGVARVLFAVDNPISKMNAALTFKGAKVAERFFDYGFGGLDSEISYTLIHINPPYSAVEGKYLYSAYHEYDFASEYVLQRIVEMHTIKLFAQYLDLFNQGGGLGSATYGGASAGNLFEKICIWIIPLAGEEIAEGGCISLIDGQRPLGAFKFPTVLSSLPHDFKKTHKNLTTDVFYRPLSATLESGDSFCVLNLNGIITLIVMQFTVAENHGVRYRGLTEIYEAIEESVRVSIEKKVVLFVTPLDSNLRSKQAFLNAEGKLYKQTTDFEQWVYKRKLVRRKLSVEEKQPV